MNIRTKIVIKFILLGIAFDLVAFFLIPLILSTGSWRAPVFGAIVLLPICTIFGLIGFAIPTKKI